MKNLEADNRRLVRENRKLQHRLNAINNAIPGAERIWNIDRIAIELEAEAETIREKQAANDPDYRYADPDGLDRDALFLQRMQYDLITLRERAGKEVRGSANRKYDPSQWPRGERP